MRQEKTMQEKQRSFAAIIKSFHIFPDFCGMSIYVDLCRCGAGTKNPVRNKNTSACVFGLLVFSRAAISLFRRWRAHHALDAWIDHHTDIVSIWCRLVRCMKLLPAPQPQHANNNIFSIENVSSRESLFVSCHGAVVIAILQHGRMFVLRLRCSFE